MMTNKTMIKMMINERLTKAAEEIFALFEQSIAEYQLEIDRLKNTSEAKQLESSPNPQAPLTAHIQEGDALKCKEETEELMITEEHAPQILISEIKTEIKGDEFEPHVLQLNVNGAEAEPSAGAGTDCSFEPSSGTEGDSDTSSDEDTRETHGTKRPFSCAPCKKRFRQQRGLKMHIKWAHGGEKPLSPTERPVHVDSAPHSNLGRTFSCTVCKRLFKLRSTLDAHMREHTGGHPFHCSACVASFANNTDFTCHIKTVHSTENPFRCSVCNRSLKNLRNYKSHMRLHTGERPFRCSVCGRGFLQKGNLKYHMLTHSGEKPFSCSECGARYTSKQNLMHHKKVNH